MELPKRPNFSEYEQSLSKWWEEEGFFKAKIDPDKKPFTILLPPPNANAPLHAGHALYVVEDILSRFYRMQGRPTLFLPGTDHAGIETQFVLEKKLKKEGKSRFDYDRESLYKLVHDFVEENRGVATDQLRRLGFSLDWSREKYTLNPEILEIVYSTFKKLHEDGLIYRDERLVNYCTRCGTGFSNLEINHAERDDHLYYLDYDGIEIATTRPETIFADVAVAVNPNDPRHKDKIGKTVKVPLINKEIPVIGDGLVEIDFGTGALKITPGHDQTDFEIGKKHGLERISVINRFGRMVNVPEYIEGLNVKKAREITVEKLKEAGKLIKVEDLHHAVGTCYKCKSVIEPLLVPQWYVKVKPLVENVIKALDEKRVSVFPERFERDLRRWLETAPDWNISRQIVWGPQIPAWYDLTESPDIEVTFLDKEGNRITGVYKDINDKYEFDEIKNGLQSLIAPVNTPFYLDPKDAPSKFVLQETDTFDTWFSSGQWPLTTLGFPDSKDFKYFYPTTLLDTMWDILAFWIMRMLMLGIYRTGEVPFKWIHLHSRVVDARGQKMSKSKGNVVNPMDLVEKYGADALRFALMFGVAPASDIPLGEEKMIGGRNFVTKIWNISRFIFGQTTHLNDLNVDYETTQAEMWDVLEEDDKTILNRLNATITQVTKVLDFDNDKENHDKFQFARALDALYNFIWDDFASWYIEAVKERLFTDTPGESAKKALWTLVFTWREALKLLHPFMPFITEEIYQKLPNKDAKSISIAKWPQSLKTTK